MAPDKLYVVPLKTESQDAFVGLAYELDRLLVRKTEYIRKDALLEWAKIVKQQAEELKEAGQGNVFYGVQIALIDEVIAKIKSL